MERKTIRCPVCDIGPIQVLYTPPLKQQQKKYYGAGHPKMITVFTDEKYEVLEDCSKCKAKREDIERRLKQAECKPLSRQEILKRLKDAGLPTKV